MPLWQPERVAQWLDEALDALAPDRVHLAGSSYGGRLRCARVSPPGTNSPYSSFPSGAGTPLHLVLGKRSLLVHPRRQVERVPRLIPGTRVEIISDTRHVPQFDHTVEINRRMPAFMALADRRMTGDSSSHE